MSLIKVQEEFKKYGIDNRIIVLNNSTATVEKAANMLNCEEGKIAKTMAFKLKEKNILIVLSGDSKIDNSKYKNKFNEKAKMINFDELNKLIGHEPGGVCPFAIKEDVEVYLDESLKTYKTVYPACGSSNSAIELTIEELENYSNYKEWINVSK